jgi:addiction module RelE/StbE family toxin
VKLEFSRQALDDYARLPDPIQQRADLAFDRLAQNLSHPSLRVKKLKGWKGVWEARISHQYRMTFRIVGETCLIRRIGPHDIEKTP